MLKSCYSPDRIEAGCDEAGRGCLAGPVFAAAVILSKKFRHEVLNDSKKLTVRQRNELRLLIESEAIAWAVASVDPEEIDRINILNASFLAMHRAIAKLSTTPELLLIDGNRFNPYPDVPHHCIVKGDAIFLSIAAASVLAKTYRDGYMEKLHDEFPFYDWKNNKGYPCKKHREGLFQFGVSSHHRKSYNLFGQLRLDFN
ncbi:MAG: ribonuclease HII [Bacteroidetes bacterium]|nr:ribonuclease HII [Bacteroidota bacterium]